MINKIKWTFQGVDDKKIEFRDYMKSMFFLGGISHGRTKDVSRNGPLNINSCDNAMEQLYEVVKIQRGNGYDAFVAIPKTDPMELPPEEWAEICERVRRPGPDE